MEGQAHRRSGAARILGIGKSGGLTPPLALAGVFGKGKMEVGMVFKPIRTCSVHQ